VTRLKAEWPDWGTRRIAGQLARLGVKVSRSSVQRIVRRGPRDPVEPEQTVRGSKGRVLLAKRPSHIWMIDFTRVGGVLRPLWVGAVIDAYSRRVLAIGAIRGAPTGAFAVLLLRRAIRSNGSPRWLVSDQDPVLRSGLVQRLLTRRGILRRYGAVGKSGSISLIERFWRSLKEEYVRHLLLYRSTTTVDGRLERYRIWFNQERPHQGQRQRTPDDVYFARPERPTRDITSGTLHVRFHDGDRRLPVLRLREAA
jgi:transposase InsO family protein